MLSNLLNLAYLQLMNIAVEAILAQYSQEIKEVVQHDVQCERSRNVAKMQAMKTKAEQTRNELAKEKGKISSLMEEIKELKFMTNTHAEHCYRAEKGQKRAD